MEEFPAGFKDFNFHSQSRISGDVQYVLFSSVLTAVIFAAGSLWLMSEMDVDNEFTFWDYAKGVGLMSWFGAFWGAVLGNIGKDR